MRESFAWQFWRRCLSEFASRHVIVFGVIAIPGLLFGHLEGVLLVLVLFAFGALLSGGLVLLSWRTVGRIVTTPAEREAMTVKQKVDAAFNHWGLPVRRAKS